MICKINFHYINRRNKHQNYINKSETEYNEKINEILMCFAYHKKIQIN
jgi:hypothetical protein